MTIINHGKINGKEVKTKYAHLSRIDVKIGNKINKDTTLGLSGGTPGTRGAGTSTGAHLHFEVLEDNIPQDPMKYIRY